jgi:hypothetical protein
MMSAMAAVVLAVAPTAGSAGEGAAPYLEWRSGDRLTAADRQTFIEWTRPATADSAGSAVCDAAASGRPPLLETLPGDAFSDSDRQTVLDWALARPEVRSRLAGRRTRVLRMGADLPKGPDGEFRRATIFVRNYDEGLTHAIYANLFTGEITIIDMTSLVQPNGEEIAEALALIGADPALAPLLADPALFVTGGFFNRAVDPADPCYRDICLNIEVMTGQRKGFARRLVVDLSRRVIANRNFQATTDPEHPSPMTRTGGK